MTTNNPVKICETLLRDAHQSLLATRMRTEDMLPLCPMLDDIGFHSLEVWGGATFDTAMRFLGEDPWIRLRELRKALPKTKLQMLLRGQNVVGYKHYPDDIVEKFVVLAKQNGIDIFRVFDALNDLRNMEYAMKIVKREGGHAQGTISYTISPVHTTEAFVKMGADLKNIGADSIAIKDMAGLITPYVAYDLVKALKEQVGLPVELHTHYTSGFGTASLLKAVEAGVDVVDCAISAMAMSTSQPPTETLVAALKGTERDSCLDLAKLADIARKVTEVRKKYVSFEAGIAPVDVNVLQFQVPGGMLSNMVSQLRQQGAMDKYYDVLDEIPRVRKDMGYPPLVTPLQPDRGHPGHPERGARRALQDHPRGSEAVLPRLLRQAPGTHGSRDPEDGHRRRDAHHLPARRPAGARFRGRQEGDRFAGQVR